MLAVGLAATALSLGANLGRWVDRFDILTHGAPIWFGAGVLVLAFSILHRRGPRKVVVATLGAVATAASALLMAPELMRPDGVRGAGDARCRIKVISFNVWGSNSNADAIAEWLATEYPDLVVIVQPGRGLQQKIAERTGLHTWPSDIMVLAGRNPPISNRSGWQARDLPGKPVALAWNRVALLPDLETPVLGIHKRWPIPASRARDGDLRISSVLDLEDRDSAIVVGDFNSTPWSFRQRQADRMFRIERRDHAIPTWPARLPIGDKPRVPFAFMPIDHLYAGKNWRTVSVERGPSLGSDHYPLVMTLAWVGALPTERLRERCAPRGG